MAETSASSGSETGSTTAVSLGEGHEACDAWIARLQAKITGYENAITWNTSCTSCATVLDSCYRETCLREIAEGKLAAIRELCASARVAGAAACCCNECEATGRGEEMPTGWRPHPSRPLAWTLDPAAVLAVLDADPAGVQP